MSTFLTILAVIGICYAFVGLLVAIRLLVKILHDDWYGTRLVDRLGLLVWCGLMGTFWLPISLFVWYLFGWKFLLDWWK